MSINSLNNERNVFLLGEGFTVDGDIRGQGTLLVSGTIKGTVSAEIVKLTETGQVFGSIECAQLDIAGKLNGDFNSHDVIIRAGALVAGSSELVSKGSCVVSGTINGNLKMNNLKAEKGSLLAGNIVANQLDVFGRITGTVDSASVIVRNGAAIDGNVHYGNLSMESGSDVTGQIERKQRVNLPVAQELVEQLTIDFPSALIQELRKTNEPDALKATLANGEPLPEWITVDRENFKLVLDRVAVNALSDHAQSVRIRLQAGAEVISFTLPPERK
jgi:cytoskeletal protein CcmA (bactofilin family)